MNWHTRLTQARKAKGINKSAFAAMLGVSPPAVTDWEKEGKTKTLEGKNLVGICAVLEISPLWLLYGDEIAARPEFLRHVEFHVGAVKPWPFSISRKEFSRLPAKERRRLDELVSLTYDQWQRDSQESGDVDLDEIRRINEKISD